jgi:hypothetical protein
MGLFYRRGMAQTSCRNGAVYVQPFDRDEPVRLEGTGRRIWELLEYPVTIGDLSLNLVGEFSGDIEKITGDTGRFLQSLQERGLMEILGETPSPEDRQRFRYLGLMKRALVNLIYPEHELRIRFLEKPEAGLSDVDRRRCLRDIRYREPDLYQAVIDAKHDLGLSGRAPYGFSHTMIGLPGLDNLERCAEAVFSENILGDFMEAGVCQGGASIFMRALQRAYGEGNRRLWVADSFEGLPPPESGPDVEMGLDLSETKIPSLAFCLEGVRDNFIRYDLLDSRVVFLPGWFADTLPTAPVEQLAILRLDADLYSSTRIALESLYSKVAQGGFVIVDDYGFLAACRQAVDEYRVKHDIDEPIKFIGRSCIYWQKRG